MSLLQDKLTRAEMEIDTLRKASNPGHLKQLTSTLTTTENQLHAANRKILELEGVATEATALERTILEERSIPRLHKVRVGVRVNLCKANAAFTMQNWYGITVTLAL